jgi:hypothetical protein
VKRTISFVRRTRCFVFRVGLLAPLAGVLLFGLAVGAGSLLAPETALANTALFRVERQFFGAPLPPATTPGGAGRYQAYIQPYTFRDGMGNYYYPPAEAIVEPGNPVGAKFTLPQSFFSYDGTFKITPKTGWPGYTTVTRSAYYNGPGHFGPNKGATGPTRIVFPTTMGNPYPNFGTGNPVTATTTFDGLYDFDRAGSINVTPGPRRFGGTFQLFYRPEAFSYQYIYYFTPTIYKAYGSLKCQDPPGVTCTPGVVSSIGDITSSGMVTRFLMSLTTTYSSWPPNMYKATTPTSMGPGSFPTQYGNASYIAAKGYYLRTIHPWTTGFAVAYNPLSPYTNVRPQLQGYDISLGGADITVTHYDWGYNWNEQYSSSSYTQYTYKQYLKGVTRVVSMVRPRLLHPYAPYPTTKPRGWTTQSAQVWTMKVFFLPEPTGLLMLGTGLGLLVVLHRVSRQG